MKMLGAQSRHRPANLSSERKNQGLSEVISVPHDEVIAVALRSTTIPPRTIVKLAKMLDGNHSLSHIFIPEGSKGGFQSLDISSACLAVSKRLHIGSGVIRILEHDPDVLAKRLLTFQELSGNRFFLGIGTGPPGKFPKQTIRSMLGRLDATIERFRKLAEESSRKIPETFIATLRVGIAKVVAGHSDGILLNFCPPQYAGKLIKSIGNASGKRPTVSCYLKIFYSRSEETAKRMLVEELVSYNLNPSYHEMFKSAGVAQEIASANSALASGREHDLDGKLRQISLANPTKGELASYVNRFRAAGVDIPCLYPYFESNEDETFMISKVKELTRL